MSDQVDLTLRLWRRSPFEWGGRVPHVRGVGDCLLSLGEYLADCGGPDLTGRWRGTYSDEAGAWAHMDACGGVEGIIGLAGLVETAEPVRGDLVALDTGSCHLGAICTGPGVAARLERGVIEIDRRFVTVVKAWRIWRL